MDKKKKIVDLVIDQGILPLYFHKDVAVSTQVLRALYRAGIRVVEYTNRGEKAIDNFLQLRKVVDKELPGMQLGVGSIRNKIEATEYINEGASFIATPAVIESVAMLVQNNNLLWVPGCMTATEITLADDLGAILIKLFPGNLLGPSYISAIREIFPELLFMPTGGIEVSEESLSSWFKSGASVVELGAELISNNLLETEDYEGIEKLARQTLQTARSVRNI